MEQVEVKFLGGVRVSYNGQPITFPFAKAEALFIYLIVNRQATRTGIASLLWSEKSEESAKRNLRNAVYAVKKAVSADIFSENSNKTVLLLNQKLKVVSDVDDFLNSEEAPYGGTFLMGISVKDADNFEHWVMRTREKLENIYTERTYKAIGHEKEQRNFRKVREYADRLIEIDEYNEEAYRSLMQSYSEQGKLGSSLAVYTKLTSKLYTDLAVAPEEKTQALYEQIQKQVNKRTVQDQTAGFFYGRRAEYGLLKSHYAQFIGGACPQPFVLIEGEMGIGKSFLKDRFREMVTDGEALTAQAACYEFEKENLYRPWRTIVDKMWKRVKGSEPFSKVFDAFGFQMGENLLAHPSMKLSGGFISEWMYSFICAFVEQQRLIIIFEDIQWMDERSVNLLKSLIFELRGKPVLFLATCRNERNEHIERLLSAVRRQGKLLDISLSRFSYREVDDFLKKGLPGHPLSKKTVDKIFFNSEGNTFFLTEYLSLVKLSRNLDGMTYKMKDVLKRRFEEISPLATRIVEIVSVFDDFAPMHLLEQVTHMDELELLDVVDGLRGKHILTEMDNENIAFKFTHRKLREYIYGTLPESKKKTLHNTIGRIIENGIPYDSVNVNAFYKLIYHYERAGNFLDLLRVKIKRLNVFFDYSHELFPVLYHNSDLYDQVYIDESKTEKSLAEIESLLQKVSENVTDRDKFQIVHLEYLHMMGRYLIKKGNYAQGLAYIDEMLEKAKIMGLAGFQIEGIKQEIYYCIQINDAPRMQELVDSALSLLADTEDKSLLAVFLRFQALCCKMTGEYDRAQLIYNRSIDLLSGNARDANKYALSIAAAYGYIGDIRKLVSGYSEALLYYKKAIQICEEKKVRTCLAYFDVKAGEAAYYTNNLRAAKQYFLSALRIFAHYKYIWGKPIAECFMCRISLFEDRPDEAYGYLESAGQDSKYLKNPSELGVLYKTKADLCLQLQSDPACMERFAQLLPKDYRTYQDRAKKYFALSKDIFEESSKDAGRILKAKATGNEAV